MIDPEAQGEVYIPERVVRAAIRSQREGYLDEGVDLSIDQLEDDIENLQRSIKGLQEDLDLALAVANEKWPAQVRLIKDMKARLEDSEIEKRELQRQLAVANTLVRNYEARLSRPQEC